MSNQRFIGDAISDETEIADTLRVAMRGTAASVCAVTVRLADDSWRGATVNSMTSVSLNPPSILVSLNSTSQVHAAVLECRRFAVNIFASDHAEMAATFADPLRHSERFATGLWEAKLHGVPVLADAAATIVCSVAATLPFGTHTIIVGAVDELSHDPSREPLVYHNGRYGRWARFHPDGA